MTPGIAAAKKAGIQHKLHEYQHDPSAASYGAEAAEKMGVPPDRVFKTLVVRLDDASFVVGVVPVSTTLNLKRIARAAGAKRAGMAAPADVERATGYVLGGVSPLGQKRRLRTVIDVSAARHPTVFVSAGRRGLDIELSPADLKTLTGGTFADIGDPS